MRLLKLTGKMGAAVAATVLLQFYASPALAHPHVWVTTETEVLYNSAKEIIGFRQKWRFDEMYTAFAIQGLDKNNDGKYDRAELQELAEVNVTSLKEVQYFTYPKLNGGVVDNASPSDYWIEHDGTNILLNFTLLFPTPVPFKKTADFNFAIYDPTFFVDFAFGLDAPIRLKDAPQGCSPVISTPATRRVSVQSLGEAFFNTLDPKSDLAAQYAKTVRINCPAN